MSDTESNPEDWSLPRNLFDTPIEYEKFPEQSPTTPTNLLDIPLPRDKENETMAPGRSTSADVFSFCTRVDKKTPVNVKLDSIAKLTGQNNYRIWSASMTIILRGITAYEVVVDGAVPAEGADATEVDSYDHLCHTARPYSFRWSYKTSWRRLSSLRNQIWCGPGFAPNIIEIRLMH